MILTFKGIEIYFMAQNVVYFVNVADNLEIIIFLVFFFF